VFRDRSRLEKLQAYAGVPTTGEQITFCNTGHRAPTGGFVSGELPGNRQAKLCEGSMAGYTMPGSEGVEAKVKLDRRAPPGPQGDFAARRKPIYARRRLPGAVPWHRCTNGARRPASSPSMTRPDREVTVRNPLIQAAACAALTAFLALPAGAQVAPKGPPAEAKPAPSVPETQQERMKRCNATAKERALKGEDRKAYMSNCLKG
jgi:hypothetical protein